MWRNVDEKVKEKKLAASSRDQVKGTTLSTRFASTNQVQPVSQEAAQTDGKPTGKTGTMEL